MGTTWDFSLGNALFSTSLLFILAGVHWYKMRKFRLTIEGRLDSLVQQFAPVPAALANMSTGFLGDKIAELETRVDEVQVRVAHIERMIEESQLPSPGN